MRRRRVAEPGVTSVFFTRCTVKPISLQTSVASASPSYFVVLSSKQQHGLGITCHDGACPDYLRYCCSCPKPFVFGFCLLQIKFSSPKTGKAPGRCRQRRQSEMRTEAKTFSSLLSRHNRGCQGPKAHSPSLPPRRPSFKLLTYQTAGSTHLV